MKKLVSVLMVLILMLCCSTVLAAEDKLIYDFELYSNDTVGEIIDKDSQSRTEFSIDSAQSDSGKALRILLGGPEIANNVLTVPVSKRNLKGYDGLKVYVCNVTGTEGISLGLHPVSRNSDGSEYYLFAPQVKLMDTAGNTTDAQMDGMLVKLPKSFRGWVIVPFENAIITDQNGDSAASFNAKNVASVLVNLDPKGTDVSGAVVLLDTMVAYQEGVNNPIPSASVVPVVTPEPTVSAEPTLTVTIQPSATAETVTQPPVETETVTPAPTETVGELDMDPDVNTTQRRRIIIFTVVGVLLLAALIALIMNRRNAKR